MHKEKIFILLNFKKPTSNYYHSIQKIALQKCTTNLNIHFRTKKKLFIKNTFTDYLIYKIILLIKLSADYDSWRGL